MRRRGARRTAAICLIPEPLAGNVLNGEPEITLNRICRHKCTGFRRGEIGNARSSGGAAAKVGKLIPLCLCGGRWRDSVPK